MKQFYPSKRSASIAFIVLALISALFSYRVGLVVAGWDSSDYGGDGYFSTSNLNWCHVGTDYGQNSTAASKWSAVTNLSISTNCSAEHVTTVVSNFGNDGYRGYAYICSGSDCDNTTAWDNTYTSCEARSNTYYTSSLTYNEKRAIATHELGHCWSLGHRGSLTSTSVMYSPVTNVIEPNTTDKSLVNARY